MLPAPAHRATSASGRTPEASVGTPYRARSLGSAPKVRAGQVDDFIGAAVQDSLYHVERKALGHLDRDGRRHRQLRPIDHRIDEHRTIMGQRRGDRFVHLSWILEADAADPNSLRHRREVRVLKLGPEVEKSGGLLLELNEAERAVIEYNHLHRQAELVEADEIAHQHGKSTVAGQRDNLAARVARLRADRPGHRTAHPAVP